MTERYDFRPDYYIHLSQAVLEYGWAFLWRDLMEFTQDSQFPRRALSEHLELLIGKGMERLSLLHSLACPKICERTQSESQTRQCHKL